MPTHANILTEYDVAMQLTPVVTNIFVNNSFSPLESIMTISPSFIHPTARLLRARHCCAPSRQYRGIASRREVIGNGLKYLMRQG